MVVVHEDNQCAQARRDLGLSRELQQVRTASSDPARGGSRGYDDWYRIDQLERHAAGEDVRVSASSVACWRVRLQCHHMTGGCDRLVIVGQDQLLLCLCLFIYPEALQADEIAMFIYKNGGDVYERSVVSRRLKDLQLTGKCASTEAYQAFTPRNLLKRRLFFTREPPLGILNQPRRRCVDFDEMGITIQRCTRTKGHTIVGIHVRKPGHYDRGRKLTVLFALEPRNPNLQPQVDDSIERPHRWIWIREISGTDAITYYSFCDYMCTDIKATQSPNGSSCETI
jgi:hypothetical protein